LSHLRAHTAAIALWLAALSGSTDATAQPAAVVPPTLRHDPGARYPARALSERFYDKVEVVLVLEIDAEGNVRDAKVETPRGRGFDEVALEAARALRFEPARRDGDPTAARIRYRYVFEPPRPTLAGRVLEAESNAPVGGATVSVRGPDGTLRSVTTESDGSFRFDDVARGAARVRLEIAQHASQTTEVALVPGERTEIVFRLAAAPTGAATEPEAPVEVVVRGEKLAPAVRSFSREEARQIPGAFGDPFRAIEAMPGITPMASGLPFFYVRGAPPGNLGYFLDGVRVPFLYHVGFGPSVVHPALIQRVDLYPGGYPARFGRFAGGIVSAETNDPRPELHGEGSVRLFDAGAMVETGFAGGRGSALVGGRYSYTGALLSLIAPEVELAYHDYQARVSYDVTADDRVTLFSFGSYDLLGRKRDDELTVLFGSEFYRLDLRYDHAFPGGGLRSAVTLGFDQTRNEFLAGEQRNALTRSIGGRIELETALSGHARFRAGADVGFEEYSISAARYADPDSPETRDFNRFFAPRTDRVLGLWTDVVLNATQEIEIVPGLRADLYRSGDATALGIDPRIAARFAISDAVRLVHAYGLVHQPPAFVLPVPALTPGTLDQGLQRSVQTSAGVEVDVADATTASLTLFYNAFFDMSDTLGTSQGGSPTGALDERSLGAAYGAELFVRRRLTERLGGFLSYTLSRSTRSIGSEKFPSAFDRTHVANAALAYDLGRGWRPGGRAVFYTGTPLQPDAGNILPEPRKSSPSRAPSHFRLDLRLEKRWLLNDGAWISFVAEVLNATLGKETFGDEEIGPITIPSLGVEGGF
jgi:TonB family protein